MHPAATLILLRETEGRLETLMMRRGSALAFMGGMWVFPGGRMDAADQAPAALARVLPGVIGSADGRLQTTQGQLLERDVAVGLCIAACREAFEEAGVLLACDASGAPCDVATVERLGPRRGEVAGDATAFIRMLEAEGLFLDTRRLVYWSHWITPSLEPKRFDTRFFVAALPPGQAASADLSELTEHRWIEPSAVPAALARGEIKLVPPTLLTLEDLADCHARHGSLSELLQAEAARATPPVMPRMEVAADSVRVVMPWDSGYGALAGEGCDAGAYPAHFTRCASSLTLARGREPRQ
jgi:8-oxo-dGTP pyrophosphatase MutT (NUDIX family)